MDPLSITPATIGIADSAITSIVELRDLIASLVNATDAAKDIAAHLDGIKSPLDLLGELNVSETSISNAAKEDLKIVNVAEAVNKCGKMCDRFSRNPEKWAKRSNGLELSLRDRSSMETLHEEKICTFRTQVRSCQDVVQWAVRATQLLSQFRSMTTLETERSQNENQLLAFEMQALERIEMIKLQRNELYKRAQTLENQQRDQMENNIEQDDVLDEIEKQSGFLTAAQTSCQALCKQVRCIDVNQTIGKVITTNDSVARVGVSVNILGKINQQIDEVRTDSNSHSCVGIWGSINDDRSSQKQS